jgi:hypothetical protein
MPQKTATDVAIGAQAIVIPLWAVQTQYWFLVVAAVCGGLLAIGRLVLFGLELSEKIKARRSLP